MWQCAQWETVQRRRHSEDDVVVAAWRSDAQTLNCGTLIKLGRWRGGRRRIAETAWRRGRRYVHTHTYMHAWADDRAHAQEAAMVEVTWQGRCRGDGVAEMAA